MGHRCPYCSTDTESRRGLHSHMMQKKSCRESMEADAYISESASETANKENNSDSPTQHANEMDTKKSASDNETAFKPFYQAAAAASPHLTTAASPHVAAAASPQPLNSPNHLATVEDAVDDVDERADADDTDTRWIEEFPYPVGVPIGEGVSCFEERRHNQKRKNEPPWSPFESREEWELAQWLITSGVSQKKIDAFLKLKMVSFHETSETSRSCSQSNL